MYKNNKIGVVIPAYNEERFITSVIEAIPDFVDRIYVVNDASTDSTAEIVAGLHSQNGRLMLINHQSNKGVGAAIISGYKKCLADEINIAAVMAGDNQMNAQYLPDLLDPIISGKADYAKGNRLSLPGYTKGMSKWRLVGNRVLTLLTKIASGYWKIGDPQNGYTAINKDALKRIDLDKVYPRYGYCNDVLVKLRVASCRVCDVAMPAKYGDEKSKIRYGQYIPKVAWLLLKSFLWRLRVRRSIRTG